MRYQRRLFWSDMVSTSGRPSPSTSATIRSWTPRQFLVEHDPLERLRPRLAGVAVPRAAGDEVHPAVAVDVQRRAAHVRRRLLAQPVPHPAVGRFHAIPEDFAAAAAGDEVRPPVAVQVGRRGLPPGIAGQFAVDEMVTELHLPCR